MHSFFLLFQKLPRRFSADFTDPALQISHTGLSRIVVDDLLQCLIAEGKHLLRKAISLQLFRNKILLCDMELLVLCIAGYLDNLHTVKERSRDRRRIICRRDKENA